MKEIKIKLSEKKWKRIDAIAKEKGKSIDQVVNELIGYAFDQQGRVRLKKVISSMIRPI